MSANESVTRPHPGYLGLAESVPALPASYYYDPEHHRREMRQIWHRHWIYVCRCAELATPRSFRTFELGDQSILLVRDERSVLRAFHNTCRHRGSVLCRAGEGKLPAAGIVCPYHAWRYSLSGELLQTSSKALPAGFDLKDFPLYRIAAREWNGFVFVSLANDPPPFGATCDQPLGRLDDWQLAELAVGHVFRKTIQCNWKVFWENYNECLHCPGVHPKLAHLVPLFGRGLQDPRDDPAWQEHAGKQEARYQGGLRSGAASWSLNGNPVGVLFPKVSAADRRAGHVYLTCLPSVFIVAHIDYVRVVRLRPLAPEQTELSIEYLFLPETLADPSRDIRSAVEFTNIVMSEDADVCELNQRGLRAAPHACGVVMPEEYLVHQFQQWIRSQLAG